MERILSLLLSFSLLLSLTACGGQNLGRNGPANGENAPAPLQDAAEPTAPDVAEPAKEAGTVWRSDDGTLSGALKDTAPDGDLCLLITRSGDVSYY